MKFCYTLFFLFALISCKRPKHDIDNLKKNQLTSSVQLHYIDEKKFALDSVSGCRPAYMQLFNSSGKHYLSFLNTFKNDIYIYDYDTGDFKESLTLSKSGIANLGKIGCYYFKGTDSLYLFDASKQRLALTSKSGKILKNISLIGDKDPKDMRWAFDYPQHNQSTANQMVLSRFGLVFPGQYIWSIPERIIKKFKFTTVVDLKHSTCKYVHQYPADIYDADYNWNDPYFTAVYADLDATGTKMVYSFPISHDLYVADIEGDKVVKTYGGSNKANAIKPLPSSIQESTDPMGDLKRYIRSTDLYAGIKYDAYRGVYYRFIQRGLTGQTLDADWRNKKVAVIIMDKAFKYLGEHDLGEMHQWNVDNSFVTQEGLNIEYVPVDNDESYLILKIFGLQPLKHE